MRFRTPGFACAGIVVLLLSACGSDAGGSNDNMPPPPTNVVPTANAGGNQTVTSGATVTLNGTASSDSDGSIASYAWTQTAGAPTVTLTGAATSQPTFAAPQVASAAMLTFSLTVTDNRGAASSASTVMVTVNPAAAGNATVTGLVTFGRVPLTAGGLNYASPVQQPARGVVVRALDAGTQAVLASGITDASGAYSLSVANNTSIRIQVVAQMLRDASQPLPRWDVRAQDGVAGGTPYTYSDSVTFNSSAGTAHNVAIPTGVNASGVATGTRASAPFAALDTVYLGIQTILGAAPATNFPALIIDWGSQAAGTFFSASGGQHIALLSDLTKDTDEFDRHVIAHEFGHYIEFNFSRADSIGGQHSLGDRLDVRVAFGEGFGYAFAAIVLNDPVALDSFVDTNGVSRAGGFNIENNPGTTVPVAPDNVGCWCSESSVWSILWDLYDTPADTNDGVALGFGPIWNVLINEERTTPAVTSIFSFITALKAARPAESAAIITLVAAQNINAATIDAFGSTETHVPAEVAANAALPLFTIVPGGGGTVVVRNVDDAGNDNKLGNHRFLSFTPSTSRSVTISLSSSNAATADPDFLMFRSGVTVLDAEHAPPQPETGTVSVIANTTYILDVYDCANGCSTVQGTAGDYDLTVTIN